VPVNADDDNKSVVTNGIPAKRDFNVTVDVNGNQFNDPELLQASVSLHDLNGGAWGMSITYSGNGTIKLWTDAKKSAPFTIPAGWPGGNFYIEGTHESSKLNDIDLQFTYTVNGIKHVADALITVTPLVRQFGVSTPVGQSIHYTNNADGSGGLIANDFVGAGSAQFKGVLDVHALKANDLAQFIQNVTGYNNAENGTKDKNGNPVGWLYQNMVGWLVKPLNQGSTYPLLDVRDATVTAPTYNYILSYQMANGIGTVTDSDKPATGTPAGYNGPPGNTGVAVDTHEFFQLFLVWQYNNNGPDGMTIIYYPVALTVWNVTFFGTAGQPPAYGAPPINVIQIPQGVNSAGPNGFNFTNQVPDQMVVSSRTIANGNLGWAAA
jgi:hypothetical protein